MTEWECGRRRVLWTGTVLAGAALLGACGADSPASVPITGSRRPPAGDGPTDVNLANTALSLELLLIHTYDVAGRSGLLDEVSSTTAALFRSHHQQHGDALAAIVEGQGATPITSPNAVARSALVDPALAGAETATDLVQIVHDLERVMVQMYAFAVKRLTTPGLRSTAMTIGGVEARHATVLGALVSPDAGVVTTDAFAHDQNPLPDGALVTG